MLQQIARRRPGGNGPFRHIVRQPIVGNDLELGEAAAKQGQHAGHGLDDHVAGARQEAREADRVHHIVADALLGLHHQLAALDRLAVPFGRRQLPELFGTFASPARAMVTIEGLDIAQAEGVQAIDHLQGRPVLGYFEDLGEDLVPAFEIAILHQRDREIAMRRRIVGMVDQVFSDDRSSPINTPQRHEGFGSQMRDLPSLLGEILEMRAVTCRGHRLPPDLGQGFRDCQGGRRVRLALESAAQAPVGVLEITAAHDDRPTERIQCVVVILVDVQDTARNRFHALWRAHGRAGAQQAGEQRQPRRHLAQAPFVDFDRREQMAALVVHVAQRLIGIDIVAITDDRAAQQPLRLGLLFLAIDQHGKVVERLGLVGVELEHRLQALLQFRGAPRLVQQTGLMGELYFALPLALQGEVRIAVRTHRAQAGLARKRLGRASRRPRRRHVPPGPGFGVIRASLQVPD
jgi:hypothetical protein